MTTIRDLLRADTTRIVAFEKELLLAHALAQTRVFVLTHPEYPVTRHSKKIYESFLARRSHHEPIAFIIGKKEFFSREFLVNRHTLVPRPETELLIEKTLEHVERSKCAHVITPSGDNRRKKIPTTLVIDIGTGSGNIVITLTTEIRRKRFKKRNFDFVATDISTQALRVAQTNARTHTTDQFIRFIHSDLLAKIPKKLFRNADEIILIANLPYLSKKEYDETPIDVRNFEPKSALESGIRGIDHYERLLHTLQLLIRTERLVAPIDLFLEIGPRQKVPLKNFIPKVFPGSHLDFFRDIAGRWRLTHLSISG